jgi:hypothetical protein
LCQSNIFDGRASIPSEPKEKEKREKQPYKRGEREPGAVAELSPDHLRQLARL